MVLFPEGYKESSGPSQLVKQLIFKTVLKILFIQRLNVPELGLKTEFASLYPPFPSK